MHTIFNSTNCPYTGLSFVTRDEWKDVYLSETYSVSFWIIGDSILLSKPAGDCGRDGIEQFVKQRQRILDESGLALKQYVEIIDFGNMVGTSNRENRHQFSEFLKQGQHDVSLLGLVGYNASSFVKLSIHVNLKIIPMHYPVLLVEEYHEAILHAIALLHQKKQLSYLNYCVPVTYEHWSFHQDSFSCRLSLRGDSIVSIDSMTGTLYEPTVGPLFDFLQRCYKEMGFANKEYYCILDCNTFSKVNWRSRKSYIEKIKLFQKQFLCKTIVVVGANFFIQMFANITKPFVPFPVKMMHSMQAALASIFEQKINIADLKTHHEQLPSESDQLVYSKELITQYVNDVLNFMGVINWEKPGISFDLKSLDEKHPFKVLYEANTLIKQDFDEILVEKNTATKVLKENEERFRIMFENAHDLMCIVNSYSNVIWINRKWTDLLGYKPTTIQELFNHIHEQERLRVINAWDMMAQDKTEVSNLDFRYQVKDNNCLYLETTFRQLKTSREKLLFVICHDITSRVKAAEEKMNFEEQLRQAEKMQAIGQLAGGIAHDFNNQLAGIIGYADLIRSRIEKDTHLINYVDKIISASTRSADLIKKLLAFARKGKYQSMQLDIHSVIREVIAILERTIDKKIIITKQLFALQSYIKGDPTQILNALLNLAINARDAMPHGGEIIIRTEVTTLNDESDSLPPFKHFLSNYIKISVIDNGIGMDDFVQKHLFEPFFTTKEQGKGTGMGLAAVYGTIKNHNGIIEVYSKVNEGTTFLLFLPLIEEKHIVPQAAASPSDNIPIMGTGKILIIDDEIEVLRITSEILSNIGYTAITCDNSRDAITCYEKTWHSIDLVILDMIMPDLSGKEVFAHLRAINPLVKVILSSGYSVEADTELLLKEGECLFLPKPYCVKELSQKISETLCTQT